MEARSTNEEEEEAGVEAPPEKRRKWTEDNDPTGALRNEVEEEEANHLLLKEDDDENGALNEEDDAKLAFDAIEDPQDNAHVATATNTLPEPHPEQSALAPPNPSTESVVLPNAEPLAALPPPFIMPPPFLFWPPPVEGMWPWMPRPPMTAAPPMATASMGIPLALQVDLEHLSDYQRLLRQQLELFAATRVDVDSPTQGRKQPVRLGQVGLRCRHCARLPLRSRGRGAVYYPSRLTGLYQAAQNMALSHLLPACPVLPAAIKEQLQVLRKQKDQAHGGKQYWADGCRALGCIETEEGLRFAPPAGMEMGAVNTELPPSEPATR